MLRLDEGRHRTLSCNFRKPVRPALSGQSDGKSHQCPDAHCQGASVNRVDHRTSSEGTRRHASHLSRYIPRCELLSREADLASPASAAQNTRWLNAEMRRPSPHEGGRHGNERVTTPRYDLGLRFRARIKSTMLLNRCRYSLAMAVSVRINGRVGRFSIGARM